MLTPKKPAKPKTPAKKVATKVKTPAKIKNLGGRPHAVIDYKQLKGMCEIHCTGEECAALLNMDYDTLDRNLAHDGHIGFADYFKKHSAGGKASLRRRQLQMALGGSVPMLIWMGKQLLGQQDKSDINHGSKDGTMTPKLIEGVGCQQAVKEYMALMKEDQNGSSV